MAARLAHLVQCPPHANDELNDKGDKNGVDEIKNSRMFGKSQLEFIHSTGDKGNNNKGGARSAGA